MVTENRDCYLVNKFLNKNELIREALVLEPTKIVKTIWQNATCMCIHDTAEPTEANLVLLGMHTQVVLSFVVYSALKPALALNHRRVGPACRISDLTR